MNYRFGSSSYTTFGDAFEAFAAWFFADYQDDEPESIRRDLRYSAENQIRADETPIFEAAAAALSDDAAWLFGPELSPVYT